jgi:FAD-linked oxidoreductase
MVVSGHSFTKVAVADDIMLRPDRLPNEFIVNNDGTVTVSAAMNLTDLCGHLAAAGLALTNMGDIRVQTLAGAIQTGTHGTGRDSGTFAEMVTGFDIVTGTGEVITASATENPDLYNAARVGLGAFGIVTAYTLAVEPAFRLHAHEFPASFDEVCASFDQWTADHDHVEFFWMPHTARCSVKHNDRTFQDAEPPSSFANWWEESFIQNTAFGAVARLGRAAPGYVPMLNKVAGKLLSDREFTDDSWKVFTTPRRVVFAEMEYALPRENLLPALRDVKALMDSSGWRISFPIEVRSVPGDTAWLSPATQRDTGYIAVHAFERTDRSWFVNVEDVLRQYDGRPHWGKLNTRSRDDLAPAYPNFAQAMAIRNEVDPQRIFANEYTTKVFGE